MNDLLAIVVLNGFVLVAAMIGMHFISKVVPMVLGPVDIYNALRGKTK